MENLIAKWERYKDKYLTLAVKSDHNPLIQEGLFCRSEVYGLCADELKRKLKENESKSK